MIFRQLFLRENQVDDLLELLQKQDNLPESLVNSSMSLYNTTVQGKREAMNTRLPCFVNIRQGRSTMAADKKYKPSEAFEQKY